MVCMCLPIYNIFYCCPSAGFLEKRSAGDGSGMGGPDACEQAEYLRTAASEVAYNENRSCRQPETAGSQAVLSRL